MEDPARPGHGFFVDGAEKIFLKMIAYVQKGYLSDVPDLNYYFIRHICQRTQFIFFRNIRSSSALESYHTHLRDQGGAAVRDARGGDARANSGRARTICGRRRQWSERWRSRRRS